MWADPDRQTGSIAEKTSNRPTEKFRAAAAAAAARERASQQEREGEGERETPQLTVSAEGSLGHAAYLFGRPLPLSENKHVPGNLTAQWEDWPAFSVWDPHSPFLSAVTSARSLLDYITSTNNFLFSRSFDWWLFQKKNPPVWHAHNIDRNLEAPCDWPLSGPPAVYSAELYDTIASDMRSELCQQIEDPSHTDFWASCHLGGAKPRVSHPLAL